jgi:flagellin-like hook-associated protein FlgL
MDEKEELIQKLKEELEWVKYRMRMLDIIEEKLLQMRAMAKTAKENNLSVKEIEAINDEIHSLEEQIKAIDSESRNL